MPQLEKGGKWVFGWCVVGSGGKIQIPPEAFMEYGYQPGMVLEVIKGSHKSAGFAICKPEKISDSLLQPRVIGKTEIDERGQFFLQGMVALQIIKNFWPCAAAIWDYLSYRLDRLYPLQKNI